MFSIHDSWTVASSFFENNTFAWIVGQDSISVNWTLTFRNCRFDVFTESVQGGALVNLDDCEIGTDTLPSWTQCLSRTPLSTTAGTETGLSDEVIAAMAGGIGGLFLFGFLIPCLCYWRRKKAGNGGNVEKSALEWELGGRPEAPSPLPPIVPHHNDVPPPPIPHDGPPLPFAPFLPPYGLSPPPYPSCSPALDPPPFYPASYRPVESGSATT
jgi:hypothetical protein